MAQFQDLPTEILVSIFREIEKMCDRAAISRSCRRFNELINPILYSKFVEQDDRSIPLLICTLLDSPHLSAHMKEVKVQEPQIQAADHSINASIPQVMYHCLQAHWGKLESFLQSHMHEFDGRQSPTNNTPADDRQALSVRDLFEDLDSCSNWSAMTTCLLILLPYLESFYMQASDGHVGKILKLFGRVQMMQMQQPNCLAQHSSCHFMNMKDVTIMMPKTGWSTRLLIPSLLPILMLPRLQAFQCDGVADFDEDDGELLIPAAIQLRRLKITRCDLSSWALGLILIQCKALTHLHIQHSDEEGDVTLHFPTILKNLRHLKHSLECLVVIAESGYLLNGDLGLTECIESFNPYEKLHTLCFNADFLYFTVARHSGSGDASPCFNLGDLPPNIAEFTLYDAGEEATKDFLIDNLSLLPTYSTLRSLKVQFLEYFQFDEESWEDLSSQYWKRGVCLLYESKSSIDANTWVETVVQYGDVGTQRAPRTA